MCIGKGDTAEWIRVQDQVSSKRRQLQITFWLNVERHPACPDCVSVRAEFGKVRYWRSQSITLSLPLWHVVRKLAYALPSVLQTWRNWKLRNPQSRRCCGRRLSFEIASLRLYISNSSINTSITRPRPAISTVILPNRAQLSLEKTHNQRSMVLYLQGSTVRSDRPFPAFMAEN